MDINTLIDQLKSAEGFFARSTSALTEEHSTYRPTPESMSTAQQVAHVAHTVDWFFEGAFRPEGFDMDFEGHNKMLEGVDSLEAARKELAAAFSRGRENLSSRSIDEMMVPLPEGPVMGGLPRLAILGAIDDHTAHHRGVLTLHARLNGLTPPMPYM